MSFFPHIVTCYTTRTFVINNLGTLNRSEIRYKFSLLQVNLFQKLLFLHQLTSNMLTDYSLFKKIVSSEYIQNMFYTQIVVFVLFWHSEQFWYTACSADVASFWKRFTCTFSQVYYRFLEAKLMKEPNIPSPFQTHMGTNLFWIHWSKKLESFKLFQEITQWWSWTFHCTQNAIKTCFCLAFALL